MTIENKIFSECAVGNRFDETKAFSMMSADEGWHEALVKSSISEIDAIQRQNVYSKLFAQYREMKDAYQKSFSGMTEVPLLGNQQFNASMASYVRSIAGFFAIERVMDQPTALLWYNDLLGVTDNRVVLPNVGKEDLNGINARFTTTANFIAGTNEYEVSTNKLLIPGTVEMNIVRADGTTIKIKDDAQGNLLAPPGVLAANSGNVVSINYSTGVITFTVSDELAITSNDKYSIIGYEDVAGDPAFGQLTGPGNNRFKVRTNYYLATAEPDMLVAESNLMAMAAANKALGVNLQDVAGAKLVELYTKLVNGKIAKALNDNLMGNAVAIPMTSYKAMFTDFNSQLEAFQGDLVDVDTALAKQSVKGVRANAYLVGEEMGNMFRKLRQTGLWQDNTDSSYINDLLGYYNGIPVIRHTDIPSKRGIATFKPTDGSIAPVIRGIFLPLTNTPIVGNYNNVSQFAQGCYYQETNSSIVPELEFAFELK